MVELGRRNSSTIGTVIGLLVAIVAIVGTQMFDWEWGSDQLVPTVIGVLAAAIALVLVGRRYL
ncbi:multidrug transporter [Halovivax limisalsi]|uniref:multidrug transporter n=1 Tax=Halovivax limisalsi TaxID=1453760 RepID=UPI001FFC4B5A|nr:multidrug transporter [Halovivax limisalsi]